MGTKAAAWTFVLTLMGVFGGLVGLSQSSKSVTLYWDAYNPVTDGAWAAVRIYDSAGGAPVLVATAPCQAGPPITCPATVTFTMAKSAHSFTARSWDGNWESDDSNVVSVPGPPKGPANLRK